MYIFMGILLILFGVWATCLFLSGSDFKYQPPDAESLAKSRDSNRYMNDPVVRALEQIKDKNIF